MSFSLTFDASVTDQQRQWFNDAVAASRFAWERSDLTVNVATVSEPPCPGHQDYMCTQSTGGTATISIRAGADDPAAPVNKGLSDVRKFYMESVIHELAHAFTFGHMAGSDAEKATICSWFTRQGDAGESVRTGVLADWNPLDKAWPDRIQEALAEFFKDVYMPEYARLYENRTNWDMDQSFFGVFLDQIESVICPPEIIVT